MNQRYFYQYGYISETIEIELEGILCDMVPLIYIKVENMQINTVFFMAKYHMEIV